MAGSWENLSDSQGEVVRPNTSLANGSILGTSVIDGASSYAVTYWVTAGTITDGQVLLEIQESETNVDADFTDVPFVLEYAPKSILLPADSGSLVPIAYLGEKRYTRLHLTGSGITTPVANLSVIAITNFGRSSPLNSFVNT